MDRPLGSLGRWARVGLGAHAKCSKRSHAAAAEKMELVDTHLSCHISAECPSLRVKMEVRARVCVCVKKWERFNRHECRVAGVYGGFVTSSNTKYKIIDCEGHLPWHGAPREVGKTRVRTAPRSPNEAKRP